MEGFSKKIIGKNVKLIRKSLSLSQLKFSELVNLSKPSIINIESGNKGYNIDLLNRIALVTGFTINEISNAEFKIPDSFRENLIEKFKKDLKYFALLNKKPNIVFVVKTKL